MLVSSGKQKSMTNMHGSTENFKTLESRKKDKIDILKLKNSTGSFNSILDIPEAQRISSSINAITNKTNNNKTFYHGTF